MPIAERLEDRIVLFADIRENAQIKSVPGARWDNDVPPKGAWWFQLSYPACVQLRNTFGQELQVGPELSAWARDQRDHRILPCLELRTAEDAPDLAIFSALYPFQRAGAKFLATARFALLADEMGLGKTVQSISALEVMEKVFGAEAYPALVVCGNSMKFPWAEEFEKWAPDKKAVVIHGSADKRRKQILLLKEGVAQVGVINYEGLRGHTRLAGYPSVALSDGEKLDKELNEFEIRSVIADEAHKIQDPRSKQTRALWAVSANASARYALTGTPIEKEVTNLWALMRFVAPNEYPVKGKTARQGNGDGKATGFLGRYAQDELDVYGYPRISGLKAETREELFQILDPRMIRRLKATVQPQLPPKVYQTRYVEMIPKQKKAYEQMRKDMVAQLDEGVLVATNSLTKMTRLLQFASAYGEIVQEGVGEDGQPIEKLILTEPSPKVDAIEEIAEEIGNQQMIVFAESKQLINLAVARLEKVGTRVGKITGDVDPAARQPIVQSFKDGHIKILFMTLAAGGEGLSFPGVGITVFMQRAFRNLLNIQAEDRTHGIGRGIEGQSSLIIDLITIDSAERRVHEVRQEKADALEEIVRDKETLAAWLAK